MNGFVPVELECSNFGTGIDYLKMVPFLIPLSDEAWVALVGTRTWDFGLATVFYLNLTYLFLRGGFIKESSILLLINFEIGSVS